MHFGRNLLAASIYAALAVSGICLPHRSQPRGETAAPLRKFGYTGVTGPVDWAGLGEENLACAISSTQSPINLDTSIHAPETNPSVRIPNVESAEVENLGTTVDVIVNGTTTVGGKEYRLSQFHFHTPSEHRIDEMYFPLEMHMVHQAADNSTLVVGAFFELTEDGTTTDLLTAISKKLDRITTPSAVTDTGPLDFGPIITHFETTPLFQYVGSLTTPPCTAGVMWLIARTPLAMNVRTFLAFKDCMKYNARYTQNTLGADNLIVVAASQLPHTRNPILPSPVINKW